MIKDKGFGARLNLKQFFNASVGALESQTESGVAGDRMLRRNCALVQRNPEGGSLRRSERAIADAAKALTTLWKMQPSKKAI